MKPELKKLLVLNLPYLLFVYLFAKCGQTYRLSAGADASAKLLHLTSGISAAFASPLPSLHPFDLCVGVVGAVAVRLIVYSKGKNAKKYRKGEEYGSARWGTAKDIAPYIDPKFENNILLTQTERLTMTGRPKDPKTARNKNVLVIGGSGSGKTRFYVKPNLMQCFPTSDYPTSFVVTDTKGTLVLETGQMFQRAGYRVKILNTINFSKSMKYNPFVYIHSEKDVLKLVNTLIANTKGEGEKSAEDFWVKSERLFYTAAYQDGGTGLARRQQELFVLPDSEVVRVFLFQPFKHEVHRALKVRVILAGFTGVYHFQQGGEVHFLCRCLVPDVANQSRVEQPFRLHPKIFC